jgi:ABC-type sugar transport system ATPase subunit
MDTDDILEMRNITKKFPGVTALDHIRFDLRKGEIHSLVGENGAGKSTMIKILAGIYLPTEGDVIVDGKKVNIVDANTATTLGISVIHQELSLVPHMTVAENIFLGRMPLTKRGFIDDKKLNENAYEVLKKLGLEDVISVHSQVYTLTVAQQQLVEIARAISTDCRILIMDEPTASLTEREIDHMLDFVMQLRDRGVAVIYISHRMEEVFKISNRITILRDGQYIGTRDAKDVTYDDVVKMMVGREVTDIYPDKHNKIGNEILRVEGLCDEKLLKGISFTLHKGEILGFYGLVGSGRTETMRYIFGIDQGAEGKVFLNGKEVHIKNPQDAIKNGIMLAPENRKEQGLVLIRDIRFNLTLSILDQLIHWTKQDKKKENAVIKKYMDELKIKATSDAHITGNLSGGNQQKVVLAKCLATEPQVLVLDEPTRGIDVGAKFEIYKLITELAEKGVGIIFISSELPEVQNLSDRIIIMHDGRKMGELEKKEISEVNILTYAMGGAKL